MHEGDRALEEARARWEQEVAEAHDEPRYTASGLEVEPLATPWTLGPFSYLERLGFPGQPPFTRGIHPTQYRGRRWTMRQYAGFGTAEATNQRFRYLLEQGQTGLSVAFDLPTQMGLDSDDPRAEGEVGRVGVAIDTVADIERLFQGIPLDKVSISMTINATAPILLAMVQVVAERRGIAPAKLRGTVQNDILKEYVARGTFIYPPRPSMRLVTDTIAHCHDVLVHWNPISVSGYHIREAGSTAVQEIAFTLANGVEYLRAACRGGLTVDEVAPRISFFFNAHRDFFEEVAKFRAARRLWSQLAAAEGARGDRARMLRFHAQTGGSTLTAQQPQVNVVRVALQALSAVLGGAQSLHCNGFDEALALPTEESATLALRTQQVTAEETGVADTIDPLGGSYWVESLTDRLEAAARDYLDRIEAMGGALRAIETGFMQREVEAAAWREQKELEAGRRRVVGVNVHRTDSAEPVGTQRLDEELANAQIRRVRAERARRDEGEAQRALSALAASARQEDRLMEPILAAVRCGCSLGEIAGTLRGVFGRYRAPG